MVGTVTFQNKKWKGPWGDAQPRTVAKASIITYVGYSKGWHADARGEGTINSGKERNALSNAGNGGRHSQSISDFVFRMGNSLSTLCTGNKQE